MRQRQVQAFDFSSVAGIRLITSSLLLILLRVAPVAAQANGHLQIHYLNVGQGDAALIISPLGQTMLIDTGPLTAGNCGNGIISTLTGIGLTHLDYHVASHYDADHIGCSDNVVTRWPVQIAAYDRGTSNLPTTQTYGRYAAAVASKRQGVGVGQEIVLDGGTSTPVTLRVVAVNGNGQSVSDENDRSVVLVLRFGTFDAEFGGDLPGVVASGHKDIESAIASVVGELEVYKVHHHGSATSSNATFMAAIHPKVAVLSVGSPNAFDHPTQSALDRIRTVGTTTYWTTAGDGASATSPYDVVVNGTVWVDVPTGGTSFSVTRGSTTDAYNSWGSFCTYDLSATSASLPWSGGSGSVTVTTGGGCNWVATSNAPFLTVTSGASGSGSGVVSYSAASTSGARGGTLTMAGLTFSVNQSGPVLTGSPFGSFDTPLQGQTSVAGSIAVTGWALDDTGVDRVEIWRDLVPGETTVPFNAPGHPGHGKVYIANPLFITGARPDVAAAYSAYPNANRAGWGYLLLTWGLWNQGNGPFTLYAFAFDNAGSYTTLGTKAITVSNQTAIKPFGGIDTPTYGQTVTGSFWNFGWALTPKPNSTNPRSCVIANGNVQVGIDSGPLVNVSYGDLRADIEAAFPGFSNGAGAGGAYFIDTTTLTNGTHLIGWLVTDNCGRQDGIGSRFFTVQNGPMGSGSDAVVSAAIMPAAANIISEPIEVRRGDDSRSVYPNSSGDRVVSIGEGERVAVHLPHVAGAQYSGDQIITGRRQPLPLGSSLDARAGIFYWQPAAGFLGGYDLAFTANDGSRSQTVLVRVVVGPSIRMAIDTPQPTTTVVLPFSVAGWALDLAAADGIGIDTVHVWAYPTSGGNPIFLGVASIGDARPDVATTYGDRFTRSAYNVMVNRLPAGTYDIVVYPHSAVAGDFRAAQTVRATVR